MLAAETKPQIAQGDEFAAAIGEGSADAPFPFGVDRAISARFDIEKYKGSWEGDKGKYPQELRCI